MSLAGAPDHANAKTIVTVTNGILNKVKPAAAETISAPAQQDAKPLASVQENIAQVAQQKKPAAAAPVTWGDPTSWF